MPIQAFIDDSLEKDEVLILAGYIASADAWAKFSQEWQERLDMSPRWASFKMNSIGASRDEARWERAGWFYRVIEDHALNFVAIAVKIGPLRDVVRKLGLPEYLENPYILGFRALIDFTIQFQHELGITEPIDFIFDERGEKNSVRNGFEVFKQTCRVDLKSRIGREPRFEKDEDFLPLQAADLLAWHVRRHWLRNRSITTEPLTVSWAPTKDLPGYRFELDREGILINLSALKDRLREAGYLGPTTSLTVSFSCDLSSPISE